METFDSLGVEPVDTHEVVIVDGGGTRHKEIFENQVCEDIGHVKENFNAFFCSVDVSLGRAAGSDRLTFGHLVDRTSEPYEIAGDGAGFK